MSKTENKRGTGIENRLRLAVIATFLSLILIFVPTVKEKLETLKKDYQLQEIASLAEEVSHLIHELQKERGISAIFLSSGGELFLSEMKGLYETTDVAALNLEEKVNRILIKKEISTDFQQKISIALRLLKKRKVIRKKTLEKSISKEKSFSYYNGIVDTFAKMMAELALVSSEVEISNAVITYIALMEAKEMLGRERALGSWGVVRGGFLLEEYEKFIYLQGAEEALYNYFLAYATTGQKDFLAIARNSFEAKSFDEMRQVAIDGGVKKGALKNFNIEKWFKVASDYLGLLKDIELELAQNLYIVSTDLIQEAVKSLVLVSIFFILFMGASAYLLYVIHDFTNPLLKLSDVVIRLANGNLDVKIPNMKRDDEIGKMALAINFFKKSLREKEKIMVNLEHSKELAETAVKTKANFLATMSHEIRTPMNGVLSSANLLFDNVKKPENIKLLGIIQSCGESLLTIINDILDFSKIESGKIDLEEQPYSLQRNIEEVVDLLKNKASEEKGVLDCNIAPEVPLWIKGDVTRFRQVLTNLVGNAIKFTKDKVEVRVKSQLVDGKRHELLIEVEDNGIGMSKEGQTKLFKSFTQVDSSTTRKFGGTGLGLAICKGLIEAMGGKIWVNSEEGKGSTFSFSFIAEETAAGEEKKLVKLSDINPRMGVEHPLKILMAEDNSVNQIVGKKILSRLGYRIDIAGNGKEAVQMFKQQRYDVILMDQHMPEMDGIEATKHIVKKYLKEEQPRIVALTASGMKEDKERCFKAGMSDFLTKPINVQELVAVLENCQSITEVDTKYRQVSSAIDVDYVLSQFAGEEALLKEVVQQCLEIMPQYMMEIEESIVENDAKKLEIAAHTLKGTVANFHSEVVREAVFQMELLGKKKDFSSASDKYTVLQKEISKLQADLELIRKDVA